MAVKRAFSVLVAGTVLIVLGSLRIVMGLGLARESWTVAVKGESFVWEWGKSLLAVYSAGFGIFCHTESEMLFSEVKELTSLLVLCSVGMATGKQLVTEFTSWALPSSQLSACSRGSLS